MTLFEIISVVISSVALIVAIISLIRAHRSDAVSGEVARRMESLARTTAALEMANVELFMNERITNTKEKVAEISLQMTPLLSKQNRSSEEDAQIEVFIRIFDAAVENNLNAYEETCAKYLDGKIDKERFIRTYRREIRQLVENESFKEKDYFDGVTSPYKAILKVYDEWENLEK